MSKKSSFQKLKRTRTHSAKTPKTETVKATTIKTTTAETPKTMPKRADGGTTLDTIADKLKFGHPDNRTLLEAITLVSRVRRVLSAADHVKECIDDKVLEAKDIDSVEALDELKFAVEALVGKELYTSSIASTALTTNRTAGYTDTAKVPLTSSYGSYGGGYNGAYDVGKGSSGVGTGTYGSRAYPPPPAAPPARNLDGTPIATNPKPLTGPGHISRVAPASGAVAPVTASDAKVEFLFDENQKMYKLENGARWYWVSDADGQSGWRKAEPIIDSPAADSSVKLAPEDEAEIEFAPAEGLLDADLADEATNPEVKVVGGLQSAGWPRVSKEEEKPKPASIGPTPMGLRDKDELN
jgi:hypothetical protein